MINAVDMSSCCEASRSCGGVALLLLGAGKCNGTIGVVETTSRRVCGGVTLLFLSTGIVCRISVLPARPGEAGAVINLPGGGVALLLLAAAGFGMIGVLPAGRTIGDSCLVFGGDGCDRGMILITAVVTSRLSAGDALLLLEIVGCHTWDINGVFGVGGCNASLL